MEKFSTVPIKTLRRPMRSASQPQMYAPMMAPMPELISTTADWPKVSFQGPIRKASTKPIRK
jgi:hypothetical protein